MPTAAAVPDQTQANGPLWNRVNLVVSPIILAVLVKVLGQYCGVALLQPLAALLTEQVILAISGLCGVAVSVARAMHGKGKPLPKLRKRNGLPLVPPPSLWLLVLALLVSSCGAHWPKGCTQTTTAIACSARLAVWHIAPHPDPAKKRPAGVLQLTLDGELLPVTITADEVVKP